MVVIAKPFTIPRSETVCYNQSLMDFKNNKNIQRTIDFALFEDIKNGDTTSQWIMPKNLLINGDIIVKENGVIAGIEIAKQVFKTVDKNINFKSLVKDGSYVKKGQIVAHVRGKAISILSAERTALNFIQRMSGIATMTSLICKKIQGTKTKILDTRKTVPGLRLFDKWAVSLGGGQNHRFGLYDMILIKNNHIRAAKSITAAVEKIKIHNVKNLLIEVEVENLKQLKEALSANVDIIMLDNMSLKEIKQAVKIVKGKVKLEVSGGINKENVLKIAKTGVDYISIGALTHSVKALDISLKIYQQ